MVCHQFAHGTDAAVAQVVDVVANLFAGVNLNQELHRVCDVVPYQSMVFQRRIVVKFLVELVASDAAQVVAAVREEHGVQVLFRVLDSNRLARHKDAVDIAQGVLFCGLVNFRSLFGKLDFLALKAVDDDVAVKGKVLFVLVLGILAGVKFNDFDFLDAVGNQVVDVVRMQAGGGLEKLFLLAGIRVLYVNGL